MAEVRFSAGALRRLREIETWLAERNPGAADRGIREIAALCKLLGTSPRMGRAIPSTNLRFHLTRRYRYRVIYRVKGDAVEIRDVLHPRQDAGNMR